MLEIEKLVPFPTDANPRGGAPFKNPFHLMEVGDSVAYPSAQDGRRAMKAAKGYGYRHGKKFIGRPELAGYRIWRKS
jgi:hypothetical protein